MYTYITDEGVVIRNADGIVVSPCQSADDPAFLAYQKWAIAGGELTVIDTKPQ